MQQRRHDDIIYFQFNIFSTHPELIHGVFTRAGGVSPPPYDSLNLALTGLERPENVARNQDLVRRTLDLDRLIWARQVHGARVTLVDNGRAPGGFEADGLATRRTGVGLMVKLADCQGVILYDAEARAVGVIHCGWRGNVRNILGRAVGVMSETLGCDPARLLAGIGPSLGPCCAQFTNFDAEFGPAFAAYRVEPDRVDLWALSRDQLVAAGMRPDHIEIMGLCTRCRTDLFYSYRAARGLTGRFGAVAGLRA
ncbi:MAG: polyphenol oxidase family protein [Proteobacteria bacterium]|nr:polyphenol oxidase family protein [Pseudomonadota bacterium]